MEQSRNENGGDGGDAVVSLALEQLKKKAIM